jgi:glucose-1-phosphate thymidylyltransferase
MAPSRAKGLILAGGSGGAPTPLLPVANKPVLVHGIEALRDAGVREVGVAVSPATSEGVAEELSAAGNLGVETTYVLTDRPLGLLDALTAAGEFLEDRPCVAHQGDGLLRHDVAPLVDEVARGEADALLLVHRDDQVDQMPALDDGRLLRVLGRARRRAGLSMAGVHVFGSRFLREARGGQSDVAGAVERLLRAGGRARTTEIDGWWQRVGDAEGLLKANRLVLDDLEGTAPPEGTAGSSVQGRVAIHPSARLEATVVRGPAVIGADAVLRDAYIGPYSSIGDGVRVEGAEIEHSIVLAGAVIEHLGGRLEASVVGRGARVYRDFALPRAYRLRVGDGNEISLA